MTQAARKLVWQEALLSDPSMSNPAKVLGAYLMHRVEGDTLEVEMAATTIAEDLRWSLSTVSRATKELRQKWILVGQGPHANVYALNLKHVEAAHERLKMIRSRRRERRQRRRAEALVAQNCHDESVKSDHVAQSKVTNIPCEIPGQSSQREESSKNGLLKAIPHAFAAECELLRLLGDGDQECGLEIANFIGQHHFGRLQELLQQGELTHNMLTSAAASAVEHVQSR